MSLFGNMTYENLLESALSNVSQSLDKREGSIVFNGVAPAMAELAQLYIALDFIFTATYISSAPREYLIKRAIDRGMSPKPASCSVFRAEFNVTVPIGTRFSCGKFNFVVTERMPVSTDTVNGLSHRIVCETAGSASNACSGVLVPIENVSGLTSSNIAELLTPGDDDEETETFRKRVLDNIKNHAFGGNIADYKEKVLSVSGISAVKVHPVWNSDISPASLIPNTAVQTWYNGSLATDVSDTDAKLWITSVYNAANSRKLTVGGTVKVVVMASNNTTPSSELINTVQTMLDPVQNAGGGTGLAPIGHVVTVVGVTITQIAVSTHLTMASGFTFADAKTSIDTAVKRYFDELSEEWGTSTSITVRISHIESRILSECPTYITDISGTTLNGTASNVVLGDDCIPALPSGGVTNV